MDTFSIFFKMKVHCVFSLESPQRGDSNEYTQYTIFQHFKENYLKLSQICNYGICSKGLKNEFETVVVNEPSVFEPMKFYCTNDTLVSIFSNVRISCGKYKSLKEERAKFSDIFMKKTPYTKNKRVIYCNNFSTLKMQLVYFSALRMISYHFSTFSQIVRLNCCKISFVAK